MISNWKEACVEYVLHVAIYGDSATVNAGRLRWISSSGSDDEKILLAVTQRITQFELSSLHLTLAKSRFLVQNPAKFKRLPFVILAASEPRKFVGHIFQLRLIMRNPRDRNRKSLNITSSLHHLIELAFNMQLWMFGLDTFQFYGYLLSRSDVCTWECTETPTVVKYTGKLYNNEWISKKIDNRGPATFRRADCS